MGIVTQSEMYYTAFETCEHVDFFLDGVKIGDWSVPRALQSKYGEFWPEDNFKPYMKDKLGFGGEVYEVRARIERAIREHDNNAQ